jgi:metal-sulfur cluster biosynthetic enzyme
MATEAEIRSALKQVQGPELGRSIIDLGMMRDLKVLGSGRCKKHEPSSA